MSTRSLLRTVTLKCAPVLIEQAGHLLRDVLRQRHERRMAALKTDEANEADADEDDGNDTDDATQPDE